MKILHLYTHLNIVCGISKTIYQIATNTDESIQHVVYCHGGDALSKYKDACINVFISKLRSRGIINTFKSIFEIIAIMKKDDIKIIHSHHRYFDLLAYFISCLYDVKTVTSVQSKVFGKKIISYKSNSLIACSKSIKEHLIRYFRIDPKKITVVYNFVDIKEFNHRDEQYSMKKKLNIEENCIVLGFVGRFSIKEKGIDILLESFRLISLTNKNVFLLFIGKGEDEGFIKEFVKKNKLNIIILTPKDNIYSYMQLMDIIVLPSRVEPFGIVSIEAGFLKKPFIGSNVGGLCEIIDNNQNGILFDSEDPEELAKGIMTLIKDPELRKKYGEALFNKVNDNFTSRKIIPLYNNLYHSLLQ